MIQACQSWENTSDKTTPRGPRESSSVAEAHTQPARCHLDAMELSTQIDARKPSDKDKQYIILRVPNCALIMATVQGGYAHRGEFTAAFSNQLERSKGDTCVFEMFAAASKALSANSKVKCQLPEFRSTLRRKLRI